MPCLYEPMPHVVAPLVLLLWVAGNMYVWSLKQEQVILFWEALALGGIAFPAFFLYVTRFQK